MKKILPSILFVLAVFTASAARSQTFSVVYNFGSQVDDPIQPESSEFTQGRDGNLYSVSYQGGDPHYNWGEAFMITGAPGVLTGLYNFGNPNGDGIQPFGGLTLGSDGNYYGTTFQGSGASQFGAIFQMTPAGGLTQLYAFTGGTDGGYPLAQPIQGTDGNFYGTTDGNTSIGGTIYKITPSGTFTSLYQFPPVQGPTAALTLGTDGNFYGTTYGGGSNGMGIVFKFVGATKKLTVLFNFDGSAHGANPHSSPLVQGTDGNFYGTTDGGGPANSGVIFKITPQGRITVLHKLNGTSDGGVPEAGLVLASDGNFYGTTLEAGKVSTKCPTGCGTIFRITPAGVFHVVHNFDFTDGSVPSNTLFQHTDGLLYGMTNTGGTGSVSPCTAGNFCGTVFSINSNPALPAFVALLPYSGKVGNTVEILGQGFTGTTAVSFGGASASFTVSSDTYLTAVVPSGATTAAVNVTTPGGTLTSNKTFRVTPQLKSFAPPSGPVGTSVTITGVSLTEASRVTFGGVAAASFTVNSDTTVTAVVPTGAKTGKIAITTSGGTATSTSIFTVTT